MSVEERMTFDHCPRCGGIHEAIVAHRFKRPPSSHEKSWSTCPETGEPIIWDCSNAHVKASPSTVTYFGGWNKP